MCQQPDQSFIFQQALIAKHIFCLHAHLQSCTWSRDKCFGSDLQDSRYLVQAFLTMSWMRMITIFDILVVIRVRPGRPLALSEPEPTRPFGIPLPEPTYLHQPDLYLNDFELFKEKGWNFLKYVISIFIVHKFMQHFCHISIKFHFYILKQLIFWKYSWKYTHKWKNWR